MTGAARGIGLAISQRILAEGWRVGLLDIDGATLFRAMERLAAPTNTLVLECDVAEPDQVALSVHRLVGRFGRIDALINNAGIAMFEPLLQTTTAEWQRSTRQWRKRCIPRTFAPSITTRFRSTAVPWKAKSPRRLVLVQGCCKPCQRSDTRGRRRIRFDRYRAAELAAPSEKGGKEI